MWILKEPWHLYTASGNPKGGDWYFTKHFNTPEVWKDQEMWKVMIQINYGIRNNLKWSELDFIDNKPEMSEELKKIAYINVGKMPAQPVSPDGHMLDCYNTWAEIIHKQIELYSPNVIIFGKTFEYFYEYFKINEKPISTVSGKW